MARTINQIYDSLIAGFQSAASAVGITINPNNWSRLDYKRLFLNVTAEAHAIQEQLHDSLVDDVEAIALTLPPQTPAWFQHMMLDVFEYDLIAVPIVQLSPNLVPYYPVPNPNFRIIKYCSVVPGVFGTTVIKIAGNGPSQITSPALDAAQAFVNIVGVPGIQYSVESKISDKLFIQVDVYYSGLYSAVIGANVTAAINNYLQSIPFNGIVKTTDLLIAMKSVTGVIDVVFYNLQARDDSSTFGTGTDLILNYTTIHKDFQTVAGYIIPETTIGKTLTDYRDLSLTSRNLNLIPQ